MTKVNVFVHGDKQWDFEPQVHDRENHTMLTPNLSRLPPCPGGATLKVGKRILGTVEKTIARGAAFIIVYKPHVPVKRKLAATLKVEVAALEPEVVEAEPLSDGNL